MNETGNTLTKPNHPLAIVSLVLGILGVIAVLPVIGPIGAIIAGIAAKKEILQNPTQYSGENLAQAGVVLGWIGVALSVLLLTVICLGILFLLPVASLSFPMQ